MSDAYLGGLELADSRLTHLRGVGVRIDGSVDISRIRPLDEGRDALCWAKLSRAFLGGHVLADDVTLRAPATMDGEDRYRLLRGQLGTESLHDPGRRLGDDAEEPDDCTAA